MNELHLKNYSSVYKVVIVLDFFWALCALVYDLPAIEQIPFWALPFIVICPLYPLLLAFVWMDRLQFLQVPAFLRYLALIPSTIYGGLSLIFYPLVVVYGNQELFVLLQIPWVLFYALQAFYLLRTEKLTTPLYPWLAFLFFVSSLLIQYFTDSFGYLGLELLSPIHKLLLLSIGICSAAYITSRASQISLKRLVTHS